MALPTLVALRKTISLPIRALTAAAVTLPLAASANTGVTITSYGHSALLIRGGGATVLLNPFKAVGCAAGLAAPRVSANVILASSRL
ncbi:MAG: MBL fold metallo-hydrolase, partial [Vulcanococcus sp.]